MLQEGGRHSVEGTLVSGKGAGGSGLEESATGKLVTGAAEVSSGAVRAVTGVADNHLGHSNREGLWTFWMVQYRRIQWDYHLHK